jgi:Fur family ferric uptake transcriptional regulator
MTDRPTFDHITEIHHSGLKATAPRIKILRVFQESSQRHWSAEDVYRKLLEEHAEIGLATTYRVLMQFVQAGLLSRTYIEAGKAIFELNEGRHHDHLVCVRCGRVEEFCDPEIEARQQKVAEEFGFELKDHALSLYGVCSAPECRRGWR